MVWGVWSVVVDAEVPVKIMVGQRGERSPQKRGFASKCANVLNPRRNMYQSHHAGREPPSILSVINY